MLLDPSEIIPPQTIICSSSRAQEGNRKQASFPALASGSTLNDRLPRLHRVLWPLHNSPHYERLMRRPPVLPGYDPSSEMGPKSHTTITAPTREARTRLLSGGFSSVNSRCPIDELEVSSRQRYKQNFLALKCIEE
ncbi:hypothetical protein AVEN_43710-1 [Araneus ventricosus]|uniref:Uncharacterized protein n=1 Tax=Araneus ventricosus TaxID=182803 RepID=A0A4Y2BX90_ARAVE|nr:hypothetical protein AVEN_43710-1 [Araneus ventricosus]